MMLTDDLTVVIMAFVRISTFLFMIPILSTQAIPSMAKITLAAGISLSVVGKIDVPDFSSGAHLMGYIFMQIVIGVTLAKIVEMLISIPKIAGAIMDIDMGFSMAMLFDPISKTQTTILSTMMNIIFVVIFIAVGGLQQLIISVIRSFELTETLIYLGSDKFLEFIVMTFMYMFTTAVQIALPVMGAMFVVNFVLLIVGKTAPQTQIFSNMFSIKIAAGIIFLAVITPVLADVFINLNDNIMDKYIDAFNYVFKK